MGKSDSDLSRDKDVHTDEPGDDLSRDKDVHTDEPDSDLSRDIDELTKNKLEIEIKNLKRWYLQFLPLATAFVAVGGLMFGVIQFSLGQVKDRDSRERERQTILENQIRSDQKEILKLAEDKNQTLSRTKFLLWSLNKLMDESSRQGNPSAKAESGRQAISRVPSEGARLFTESLVRMIKELDMETSPRDVSFPLIAMTHWNDYEPYLKERPEELRFILQGYILALRDLRTKEPEFIKDIVYSTAQQRFIVHDEYYDQPLKRNRQLRFSEVFNGFTEHLKLMESQPDVRNAILQKFASTFCSRAKVFEIWREQFTSLPCADWCPKADCRN